MKKKKSIFHEQLRKKYGKDCFKNWGKKGGNPLLTGKILKGH